MDDVEARLRDTLGRKLDAVVADPALAAAAVRRARRGRTVRGVAAGLACVLVAGATALAWERSPDERRPSPAAEPEERATFRLDFGDSGDGTFTVDVPKAQACILLSRNLHSSRARLHYTDGTTDDVVEYLPPVRRPMCHPLDPSDAARVLAKPTRHYIALDRGDVSARSPLEPWDPVPELSPSVAEIVCSQDGAVALTPRVQPQNDGVRFRIYNQDDGWEEFSLTSPEAGGNAGGNLGRRRVFDNTWNIPPGEHLVGCFRDTRSVPYDDPTNYTSFTVVDPHDRWIDPTLHCDDPRKRRRVPTGEPARGPSEYVYMEELIRDYVPGVRDDDEIVRATYPTSAAKLEHRTLIRDGLKIATFYLVTAKDRAAPGGYVWAIAPSVCPGSDVGPRRDR